MQNQSNEESTTPFLSFTKTWIDECLIREPDFSIMWFITCVTVNEASNIRTESPVLTAAYPIARASYRVQKECKKEYKKK